MLRATPVHFFTFCDCSDFPTVLSLDDKCSRTARSSVTATYSCILRACRCIATCRKLSAERIQVRRFRWTTEIPRSNNKSRRISADFANDFDNYNFTTLINYILIDNIIRYCYKIMHHAGSPQLKLTCYMLRSKRRN